MTPYIRSSTALRFAIVGLIGTAIYCVATLGLMATPIDLSPGAASFVGFALSLCFSYVGHAYFTYRISAYPIRHGIRFAIATIVMGMSLSWFFNVFVTHFGVNPSLATLGICLLYPPLSFATHTLWSFVAPAKQGVPYNSRASTSADASSQQNEIF